MALQYYDLMVRNGGVPAPGLAGQLNSAQVGFAPSAPAAAITSGLPQWAEYANGGAGTGRYVAAYDCAASGPLTLAIDAGAGISDPNERYATLSLRTTPAQVAGQVAQINVGGTAGTLPLYQALGLVASITGGGYSVGALNASNQRTVTYTLPGSAAQIAADTVTYTSSAATQIAGRSTVVSSF